MYEKIPQELKDLKRWCCYRLEKRNGKYTKTPVNAHTGGFGKSNDETTWADFNTALVAIEKFHCDGLGFYFKPPYFGIDIDKVSDEITRYLHHDHEDNIVSECISTMESYSEFSQSGTGIHIIAKGKLPDGGRRKGNVEMYDSGRFFVMTGKKAASFDVVEDVSDLGKIEYLHDKYIGSKKEKKNSTPLPGVITSLTENEIIDAALKSKNGTRFKFFLEGGWEQFYNSQSEADMAFANDLAFWTDRDFPVMDSIFRSSSLFREKWDNKRGDSTYGVQTLNKAISDCTETFSPKKIDDEDGFRIYIKDNDVKKVENKFYSFDDTGNAQRFKDRFGDILRYSYIRKNWFYYDDKLWQIDNDGVVKKMSDVIVKELKNEKISVPNDEDDKEFRKAFEKHVKSTRSSRGKTNMIKESEHLLSINLDKFDKYTGLLNVQNGFIDLKTAKLNDHDKSKYFTKVSSVEYTDKADCPLWKKFLNQIFNNDQELISYIKRCVGYSLSGSTIEQQMFILHGAGRNGKSVFLDIVTDMLGTYATNIQPQTIMVKQFSQSANSDIARLNGARLVTTSEPNEGVRFDEGLVKQLTGGDKVTARFLYENEFDFIPQFKLWMATNHKPIIRGNDDGIWRRLAIIPFTVQIPEREVDKMLKFKLKGELTAILNWAVEGYMEWQRVGLNEPQIIKDQRQEYRTEMDVTELFIGECCERSWERTKADVLYMAYKQWAMKNNQYVMNSTKFGKEMGKKFEKVRANGIFYVGIELKKEAEPSVFVTNY